MCIGLRKIPVFFGFLQQEYLFANDVTTLIRARSFALGNPCLRNGGIFQTVTTKTKIPCEYGACDVLGIRSIRSLRFVIALKSSKTATSFFSHLLSKPLKLLLLKAIVLATKPRFNVNRMYCLIARLRGEDDSRRENSGKCIVRL